MLPEVQIPLVRLLPATFLFWLAWVVQRSPYRTAGNWVLAAFFAAVGFGFLAESLADFLRPLSGSGEEVFAVLARAAGIADPPLLLAFSLAFPAVLPALHSRRLWLTMAAVALVVVIALAAESAVGPWILTAYVDLTYLVAFVWLLNSYIQERHRFRERQLFFVVLGVGFAALSRSSGIFFGHEPTFPTGVSHEAFILFSSLGISVGLTALLFLALRVFRPAAAPRARTLFLPLLGLLLAFSGAYYLLAIFLPLGSQWFSLRWIVVGGILGYGILRHQLFDFELRTRQAVIFLASLAVGLLAALLASESAEARGLTTAMAAGLVADLLFTASAYVILTWTWQRLRPGDELPVGYRQRRVELYQAALEYSLSGAQLNLGEHLFASTLREVFDISQAEHEEVMQRIAATRVPPTARP